MNYFITVLGFKSNEQDLPRYIVRFQSTRIGIWAFRVKDFTTKVKDVCNRIRKRTWKGHFCVTGGSERKTFVVLTLNRRHVKMRRRDFQRALAAALVLASLVTFADSQSK